jgi:hypothetical protein
MGTIAVIAMILSFAYLASQQQSYERKRDAYRQSVLDKRRQM